MKPKAASVPPCKPVVMENYAEAVRKGCEHWWGWKHAPKLLRPHHKVNAAEAVSVVGTKTNTDSALGNSNE